ncbi:MAG: polymer-forming cytoskeletal protein, partial [Clostridiales bacterium]|nr:polymer-forming cytoskeletal protein [Clostridiales bacterium]
AANIHLSGTVEGNVAATGLLRILSTAKLYGDISVNSFVADEGAFFQGKCVMMDTKDVNGDKNGASEKNAKKNFKKSTVLEDVYEEKKG